jgi:chloramphenicol O-acetyltransferase type A
VIDIEQWNRKEHYLFYKSFSQPFFGLVVEINCTKLYNNAHSKGLSFYAEYLYLCIKTINEVEACKNRIVDDELRQYEVINISSTVLREDLTFGFSFVPYHQDKGIFDKNLKEEIARVKNTTGLFTSSDTGRCDVIHFSSLPWISFTGIEHAGHAGSGDTCPKISVGKMKTIGHDHFLPISLHLHHSCADGRDAGIFFKQLQLNFENIESDEH